MLEVTIGRSPISPSTQSTRGSHIAACFSASSSYIHSMSCKVNIMRVFDEEELRQLTEHYGSVCDCTSDRVGVFSTQAKRVCMKVLQERVDNPFPVSGNLIDGSRSKFHHWHGVWSDASLLPITRKVNFHLTKLEFPNPKP